MFICDDKIPENQWLVKIGERFNKLIVFSEPYWILYNSGGKRQRAKFKCDCGNIRDFLCYRVKSGYTKCCGIECHLSHSIVKDGLKRCSQCGEFLSLDKFPKHRGMKDGLNPSCKTCKYDLQMESRFGISIAEYNSILESQKGKCAICGGHQVRKSRYDIDHNHKTGKIRGLLCSNCNRAIGLLRDNVDTILKAARYLEFYD